MVATSARSARNQVLANLPCIQEINALIIKAIEQRVFVTEPYKVSGPEFNLAYSYFTELGYNVRSSDTPAIIQPHEGPIKSEHIEHMDIVLEF